MNNNLLQIAIIIFLFSTFTGCLKKTEIEIEDDSLNSKYPTRLHKLATDELIQLKLESPFQLDDYGLFSFKGSPKSGHSSFNDPSIVLDHAKNVLIENSQYSNVISDSALIVEYIKRYGGTVPTFSYWFVGFKNQIYKGLEIINTAIYIRVMDSVESLTGHHFKDIYIPEENLLTKNSIYQKIIGYVIVYEDHNGIQEKEITGGLIVDDFIKKIYWFEEENFIEFRVVWEIPILMEEGAGLASVWWYVYVDVISGEVVHIYQTAEF